MNTLKAVAQSFLKRVADIICWVVKRLLLMAALIVVAVVAIRLIAPDWSSLYRASRAIEVKDILMQLQPIGEMATYEADYTLEYTDSSYRQPVILAGILGEDFCYPGTERYIEASYDGRIKVGYRMSDIVIDVNEAIKTISVTLPKPEILSHEIISVNIDEEKTRNNILNPIKADTVTTAIEATKDEACEKAIAEYDIYTKARSNAENLICDLLMVFDEYSVAFVED